MAEKQKHKQPGPRRTNAEIANRRGKVLDVLKRKPNSTLKQIAKAVNVPERTASFDLKQLRDQLQATNATSFAEFVKGQVELLTRLLEDTYNGAIPPEVSNACRGLMDSIAKLTGSNAPEKHRVFTERADEQQAQGPATLMFVGTADEADDEKYDGQQVLPATDSHPLPPPKYEPEDTLTRMRRNAGLLSAGEDDTPNDEES
jgi:hypothetical protein